MMLDPCGLLAGLNVGVEQFVRLLFSFRNMQVNGACDENAGKVFSS